MPDRYVLGNLEEEINRLELQASLFEPLSVHALQSAGIGKGMRCIDVGCGSGSMARRMGELVGHDGQVVGMDVDEKYLDYCRKVNKDSHVRFMIGDISKGDFADGAESYDIVFSRFVFVHLHEKRNAVKSMKRLLKKGGSMIIQELDHPPGSWLCYPNDPNVEELRGAYVALLKKAGGDPLAGRKLYSLLVRESLDAQVTCFSPCLRMGHEPYSTLGLRLMDSLKPQLLQHRILSKREFARIYEGLKGLAKRKDAFVTYARFFSVSGRK